ncbi:MAG: DUF11 domain-containing protein [Chloroflexi bacterium]|nr:DUF11 domain-containing protein [Chloroflexota bacterium]
MKHWLNLAFLVLLLTAVLAIMAQAGTAVLQPQPLTAAPNNILDLSLEPVATGLALPTNIVPSNIPGDGRLFIVQQSGAIRIVTGTGSVLSTPFLDITDRTHLFGENGLLGLAFHPDYANNGFFYVYYTDEISHNNRLSRFQVSANDPNLADPNSEQILMTIIEPDEGHNGGDIKFGPDGYLYVPVGDGGLYDQSNPPSTPQDLSSPLGKILRIDVTGGSPYAPDCGSALYTIPADNPFADGPGGTCDEIWAYGLRNPWRISFDRLTGDLFITDVGQYNWEEVNWQDASSPGGQNYGWPCYEANAAYNLTGCAPASSYTFPVFAYDHSNGNCSVTGSYIYRGSRYPAMQGHYLLADFCSGTVWSLNRENDVWQSNSYDLSLTFPTTFGQDQAGEMYVLEHSGELSHIAENSLLPPLSTHKSAPPIISDGQPITYTLTVANDGTLTVTNVLITDTIPLNTSLLSTDGVLNGSVVSWQTAALAPGDQIQGQLIVTPTLPVSGTLVIRNEFYGVQADNTEGVRGTAVITIINGKSVYLPVISKR